MGPLIPQNIISGDLNFFFAFIIGIAFGFILEQAGFSSSRKLAGVFYGYDFVVLKVFFTAGITAATGVLFFSYLGWMDINMVFVNELFTWSAIVGGVIMGFGFIMGGFCPGTGFAAAVIGKIDGIIFILGIFIGVFIFGYFFDFFEPLYTANPLGRVFVFDSLGISQNLFLFILVSVAVMAFVVTQYIQDSSTKFKFLLNNTKVNVKYPLIFLFTLAFIALFLPKQRTSYLSEMPKKQLTEIIATDDYNISPIKVAHSIINNIDDLLLIDVRTNDEFNHFHLPGALNIPIENILDKHLKDFLHNNNKRTVLYSNGETTATEAWFFLNRAGRGEFFVMEGGLNLFFDIFFGELSEKESLDILEISSHRFIESARNFFLDGELHENISQDSKIPEFDKTNVQPATGGC